jgi:hypothetical protein
MKIVGLIVLALFAVACGDNGVMPIDAPPDAADLPIDARVVTPDAPVSMPDAAISLACTLEELQPIFMCVQTSCANDLTLSCITTRCGLLVLGLSPSCRQCVITGIT